MGGAEEGLLSTRGSLVSNVCRLSCVGFRVHIIQGPSNRCAWPLDRSLGIIQIPSSVMRRVSFQARGRGRGGPFT